MNLVIVRVYGSFPHGRGNMKAPRCEAIYLTRYYFKGFVGCMRISDSSLGYMN